MVRKNGYSTVNSSSDQIRVLHLIDSLAFGGAERMAVNLCNVLVEAGCELHLCSTRKSGPLKDFIASDVHFMDLNRRWVLDWLAILRLWKYVRQNEIQIIHAHSSSFFVGCLMKWMIGTRIVWHDHNGKRTESIDSNWKIRLLSPSFDAVFCVSETLRKWAVGHLRVPSSRVSYLPNFPAFENGSRRLMNPLPGEKAKRIVCIANLRQPKDHLTLVTAMKLVSDKVPDVHVLLVGADYQDSYSSLLKERIESAGLNTRIHVLGRRADIPAILQHCSIGVLSSESEGLPVSLLEYGLAGLAVVCTDVGECAAVLGNGEYGEVVPAQDPEALAAGLTGFLQNEGRRLDLGARFKRHVEECHSATAVAGQVKKIYESLVPDA